MEIIKDSAIEAWKEAICTIMDKGKDLSTDDGKISKEIINLAITIKSVNRITDPIESMKSLKKWVYPELDELEDVIFKKESSSALQYTYGARIFNFANSLDQIEEYIIPVLKSQPNSRRAIVTLYHPLIDSKVSARESPCIISIMFRIFEGVLTATAIIRSNDIFIGWPANIYQIYLLQKHVAGKLGLECGSLTTMSHSAHIYLQYKEYIAEVLKK